MSEKHYKIREKGDFEILLGSSSECHYAFTDFQEKISSRHAVLKRSGDRLFLKDSGSSQGTFINERKIGTNWHEITLHDHVFLGEIQIEIGPTLLLGRDRVGLEAQDVYFSISKPSFRVLSNHISITAEPGTLTAIMGPSGAGKTVLLNLMSGYLRPEQGSVMVGNFNVHESFGLIKDIIGYVPQEDTLIPELTVHQSLHYCLRLGYPDMSPQVRQTLIENVLQRMGFDNERLKKLFSTKIGSADQRGLSGGERRRVNIAHELVRNPLLLFLDEPTSGLSSVDSEHVVSLLKEICNNSRVTMLMTIHQPSRAIFDKLDNLLLMNLGGNAAYFGSAAQAVPYFEKLSKKECGSLNPADYVLKILDDPNSEQSPETHFEQKRQESADKSHSPARTDEKRKSSRRNTNIFYQFFLLFKRNMSVKLADKASLSLLILQAVIIALLLILSFEGSHRDFEGADKFARTWHYFVSQYYEKGHALHLSELREESKKWADEHPALMSEFSAQRRVSILFLLIASALWFGVVNGSREIVSEKTTLKREAKGSLHLSSYLMAKVFILFFIAVFQTGILLGLTVFLLKISTAKFFQFWGILIFTSVAASSLSLSVSAAVRTEQASLMAVPILIIPQLFLGGLIRPIRFLSGKLAEQFHLSDFILQKWAFKAILMSDSIQESNVLVQVINFEENSSLKYLKFVSEKMADAFFGHAVSSDAMLMIAVHAVIPLCLTYLLLKKKYS